MAVWNRRPRAPRRRLATLLATAVILAGGAPGGLVRPTPMVSLSAQSGRVPERRPPAESVVLRTGTVWDGAGNVLTDRDLVIRDGRIAEIVEAGSGRGDHVYDLSAATVLPGYIDTHVHIGNHFDDDGTIHDPADTDDPGHRTLHGAENAYRTLLSGVTTMQSLGSPDDAALKAWIQRGVIPGPRLLTSLGAVDERTGGPDEIRAYVRDRAAAGADVIKIFASTSIRFGGVTSLSAEQVEAACDEARQQGLRAVVHAHRGDAVQLAADAGCWQIEHGWLLEPQDLEVIAASGMYFGNQIDLLFRNYATNGDGYVGVAGYSVEGFENLQASQPGALDAFRYALETPGLRLVFSTDANGGSHGQNAEELVAYATLGGQPAMEVVVAATSRAAASLGLADQIGTIDPGFEADIIALDGDPAVDPEALGRVVFVMRGGAVYKHEPVGAAAP